MNTNLFPYRTHFGYSCNYNKWNEEDFAEELANDSDDWGVPSGDQYLRDIMRNSMMRRVPHPQMMPNINMDYQGYFSDEITDIGNNSYKGETLAYTPFKLDILKKKGVERVIDLADLSQYKSVCEAQDLEYYNAKLFYDYYDNPAFKTKEEFEKIINTRQYYGIDTSNIDYEKDSRKFINDFKEFVKILNKGHFYIGCLHGIGRTTFVLAMNETFNGNWTGRQITSLDNEAKKLMREFYKKLTSQDKADLGFTTEFERKLIEKLF